MEGSWMPWVSLAVNAALVIIGWFGKSALAAISCELKSLRAEQTEIYRKMDAEREAMRREQREDMAALRATDEANRRETEDSLRRIHTRIDLTVKTSDCASRMDAFETAQNKFIELLQQGITELRALFNDAGTAFRAKG